MYCPIDYYTKKYDFKIVGEHNQNEYISRYYNNNDIIEIEAYTPPISKKELAILKTYANMPVNSTNSYIQTLILQRKDIIYNT